MSHCGRWWASIGQPGPDTLGPVVDLSYEPALAAIAKRRVVAGKYLAVSVLNVLNHQVLLWVANSEWGWSGGQSNAFAAVCAAIPGYLLSRAWVWDVRGTHSFRAEILPFWVIALFGLVVSSVAAEAADRTFGSGIWVAAASLFAYFLVWVLKFALLDGMFRHAAVKAEQTV